MPEQWPSQITCGSKTGGLATIRRRVDKLLLARQQHAARSLNHSAPLASSGETRRARAQPADTCTIRFSDAERAASDARRRGGDLAANRPHQMLTDKASALVHSGPSALTHAGGRSERIDARPCSSRQRRAKLTELWPLAIVQVRWMELGLTLLDAVLTADSVTADADGDDRTAKIVGPASQQQ